MKQFRIVFAVFVITVVIVLLLLRSGAIPYNTMPKTIEAYAKQLGVPENGIIRSVENQKYLYLSPGFSYNNISTNFLKAPLYVYNPEGNLAAYKKPEVDTIHFTDTTRFSQKEYRKATKPIQLRYIFEYMYKYSPSEFTAGVTPILNGTRKPFLYEAEIHIKHLREPEIKLRKRIAKVLREENCYYLQQTIASDLITFIKANDTIQLKTACQKALDAIEVANNEETRRLKEALQADSLQLGTMQVQRKNLEEALNQKLQTQSIVLSNSDSLITKKQKLISAIKELEDEMLKKRILLSPALPTFSLIAPVTIQDIQ